MDGVNPYAPPWRHHCLEVSLANGIIICVDFQIELIIIVALPLWGAVCVKSITSHGLLNKTYGLTNNY